jgi:hypothetical protein
MTMAADMNRETRPAAWPFFKTLHVLTFVDDPAYRRQLKTMRNLQEGRHGLGRHLFHGRKGELHRAYHAGMERPARRVGPGAQLRHPVEHPLPRPRPQRCAPRVTQ